MLFHILFSLCKLMAPFTPFFVESLYQNLKAVAPEAERAGSIHYLDIPSPQPQLRDEQVERVVGRMQRVVELGRTARNNRLLTLKQPLQSLLLIHPQQQFLDDVASLAAYVKDELNVRELRLSSEQQRYISLQAQPKRDVLGKKHGKAFPTISRLITELSSDQLRAMEQEGSVLLSGPVGEQWTVDKGEVDVSWRFTGGADQESVSGDDVLVVLDVRETEELREEGLVRELLREVQKMRKKAGLVATDAVEIYYQTRAKEPDTAAAAASPAPAPFKPSKPREERKEEKAEAASEEKKEEVKDGKKGKKEPKPKKEKTPAAAAASPSPATPASSDSTLPSSSPSPAVAVAAPVDVEAAIGHQSALISSTLKTWLRPAASRPPFSCLLLSSSFELSASTEVELQLVRPSVHLTEGGPGTAGLPHRARVGLQFWLACRDLTAVRQELKENSGRLSVRLDGQPLQLQEGKDIEL